MKSIFASKTFWANVIMGILVLIQWATDQAWIDIELQAAIIAVANVILRKITTEPVKIG